MDNEVLDNNRDSGAFLHEVHVDPDWVELVCQAVDLFCMDWCGYYLRGIDHDPDLGQLVWEDDEQHARFHEPQAAEAIAAWHTGKDLPTGYYRFDESFAYRAWEEGVKKMGDDWFEGADAIDYDWVVQQALFGEQRYA